MISVKTIIIAIILAFVFGFLGQMVTAAEMERLIC